METQIQENKTCVGGFSCNNRKAKCELNITNEGDFLSFCPEPKYLGVTLDRSLSSRRHLDLLRMKLTSVLCFYDT